MPCPAGILNHLDNLWAVFRADDIMGTDIVLGFVVVLLEPRERPPDIGASGCLMNDNKRDLLARSEIRILMRRPVINRLQQNADRIRSTGHRPWALLACQRERRLYLSLEDGDPKFERPKHSRHRNVQILGNVGTPSNPRCTAPLRCPNEPDGASSTTMN